MVHRAAHTLHTIFSRVWLKTHQVKEIMCPLIELFVICFHARECFEIHVCVVFLPSLFHMAHWMCRSPGGRRHLTGTAIAFTCCRWSDHPTSGHVQTVVWDPPPSIGEDAHITATPGCGKHKKIRLPPNPLGKKLIINFCRTEKVHIPGQRSGFSRPSL